MYAQGKDWKSLQPAGCHSRKFSPAQMSYQTQEQALLAILEGLQKWEDKLLGWRFKVLTDHNSFKWLKSQPDLSWGQIRWLEYLARFDFEIEYRPGSSNAIADGLSR